MHILIIEDEIKTAAYLKKGLTEQGYTVDTLHDGKEGLFRLQSVHYDLLIVDVMLPTLSGWEIVLSIRQENTSLPILFLTARDHVDDRVKGLEIGADDYLVKPFAFSELLARIRSMLRRGTSQQQSDCSQYGDLSIDKLRHRVERDGKPIDLTAKEFSLLALFMRRSGEILSRTQIAEQVWDMNFDSDTNVIDVAVRRLRQKIEEGFTTKLIHTVRGVGYVFEQRASV